jgi:transposase-like protein
VPMIDGVFVGGKLSPEQQAELRRIWNESGWSQEAIAAHFGFSRGVLDRWRRRLGLATRRPTVTPPPAGATASPSPSPRRAQTVPRRP